MADITITEVFQVAEAASEMFDVNVDGIMKRNSTRMFTLPRKFVWKYLNEEKGAKLVELARIFEKDHSTVIHGIRSLTEELEYSREMLYRYAEFKDLVNAKLPTDPFLDDEGSTPSVIYGGRTY